jgi:hypothetical protein
MVVAVSVLLLFDDDDDDDDDLRRHHGLKRIGLRRAFAPKYNHY